MPTRTASRRIFYFFVIVYNSSRRHRSQLQSLQSPIILLFSSAVFSHDFFFTVRADSLSFFLSLLFRLHDHKAQKSSGQQHIIPTGSTIFRSFVSAVIYWYLFEEREWVASNIIFEERERESEWDRGSEWVAENVRRRRQNGTNNKMAVVEGKVDKYKINTVRPKPVYCASACVRESRPTDGAARYRYNRGRRRRRHSSLLPITIKKLKKHILR